MTGPGHAGADAPQRAVAAAAEAMGGWGWRTRYGVAQLELADADHPVTIDQLLEFAELIAELNAELIAEFAPAA